MKLRVKKFFSSLVRCLAALFCILVLKILLDPFRPFLDIQIIALLYLLPVMISTVLWGLLPGILAGFSAFLVFNFYYIQPYGTFHVHRTQDLITLIIFLFVAVIFSQFIGQAQRGTQLARTREWEATRMYELISALSGLQNFGGVSRELAEHTLETFHFSRVEIKVLAQSGEEEYSLAAPAGDRPAAWPELTIILETARGREAEMWVWHSRDNLSEQEIRLIEAYASQGALAMERIRLTKGENKARVLEESDRLKSSLLNSVSHELRTPLAVIKASVSSLRSGAVDWNNAARQDLLATIEEETDQLNDLVGNLLDMSRIESGALKPQKQWNSISEIAIGVAIKLHKHLENHHLEMDLPEDLPLVPTDFVMIGQVFVNLISNSVKYAPEGTPISIWAREEGDCMHVEVANMGPNVPDSHLERIFDKFYRANEAQQVTGTGLGLSICKGIVENHGGKIWAEESR